MADILISESTSPRLVPNGGFAPNVRSTTLGTLPTVPDTPIAATDTIAQFAAKSAAKLITIEREYLICRPDTGNDITTKLKSQLQQIEQSGAVGGVIVFPKGDFTGDGNFNLVSATYLGQGKDAQSGISGTALSSPYGTGTRLTMNAKLAGTNTPNPHNNFFNIGAHDPLGGAALVPFSRRDIIVKNMMINMSAKKSAHGILLTNSGPLPGSTLGYTISQCAFEGIYFKYGEEAGATGRAIIVYAYGGGQFEGINNIIQRCDFIGAFNAFYCNSINGSWEIKTNRADHYPDTVSIDLQTVGSIKVFDWLDVCGASGTPPNQQITTNGTVFMRTTGAWNSITVEELQTEIIEYAYQHGGGLDINGNLIANNYPRKCVKFIGGLIQSKVKYFASGTFVDDGVFWVNHVTQPTFLDTNGGLASGWCQLFRRGGGNVETRNNAGFPTSDPPPPIAFGDGGTNRLTGFTNKYSRIIDCYGNINRHVNLPLAPPPAVVEINASTGTVTVGTGLASITVYNNLVGPNSIVWAHMKDADGSIFVTRTLCGNEVFQIFLSGATTAARQIEFEVRRPKEVDSNYAPY